MLSRFYSDTVYFLESKDPGSKMSSEDKLTSGWCSFVTVVFLVPDRERGEPMFVALFGGPLGWNSAVRS